MCLSDTDSVISTAESNGLINFNSKTLLDSDILKCEDFIIFKFPQKDYDVNFVGKIVKLTSQQEMDVKFLRKNVDKFVFPLL